MTTTESLIEKFMFSLDGVNIVKSAIQELMDRPKALEGLLICLRELTGEFHVSPFRVVDWLL